MKSILLSLMRSTTKLSYAIMIYCSVSTTCFLLDPDHWKSYKRFVPSDSTWKHASITFQKWACDDITRNIITDPLGISIASRALAVTTSNNSDNSVLTNTSTLQLLKELYSNTGIRLCLKCRRTTDHLFVQDVSPAILFVLPILSIYFRLVHLFPDSLSVTIPASSSSPCCFRSARAGFYSLLILRTSHQNVQHNY